MAGIFRELDGDHDGALSFEEFANLGRIARLPDEKKREIFDRLDKDHDGAIRPEELAAMRQGPVSARNGRFPKLAELDRDRSGGVDFEEFRAATFVAKLPEARQREMFGLLDRDHDGLLTPKDHPPEDWREGFGRLRGLQLAGLDVDQDGGVSFEEFLAAEWVKRLPEDRRRAFFDRLDRDGDGRLTPKDLREPHESRPDGRPDEGRTEEGRPGRGVVREGRGFGLRLLDRDGDGAVGFEEFRAAPWAKNLTEEEQKELFRAVDKNGDGILQADEFAGRRQDGNRPPEGAPRHAPPEGAPSSP
jgi:Ca2+-binding EF-hand superfamily protein